MVNYQSERLDRIFTALADPTRRGILASLATGGKPVSGLARPYAMSLPGLMKHLRVLEDAGLLKRAKHGRVVNCWLAADPMKEAAMWLAPYQHFWDTRLDALARYLDQEEQQPWETPQSSDVRRLPSAAVSKPHRKQSGARGRSQKR